MALASSGGNSRGVLASISGSFDGTIIEADCWRGGAAGRLGFGVDGALRVEAEESGAGGAISFGGGGGVAREAIASVVAESEDPVDSTEGFCVLQTQQAEVGLWSSSQSLKVA